MLGESSQKRINQTSTLKGNNEVREYPAEISSGASEDDKVTIASIESFPASDAPAWTMGVR